MLALKPKPTFKVGVTIHTPGEDDAKVTFEFKHKGRKELKAFFESFANADKPADASEGKPGAEPRADSDLLLDIVAGLDGIDHKFTPENFALFLDNYHSAAGAIFTAYLKSFAEAEQKN